MMVRPDKFHHEAYFYADADEFLAGTVPFVRAGLEAEEAILVALPRRNLDLLRGSLGPEAQLVRFVDMERLGRNPARIIPAWHDFLAAAGGGARGIGEPIWAGRSPAELDECRRHEALLNVAFDDGPPWPLLCPYDSGPRDDSVLLGAEHNHPPPTASAMAAAPAPSASGTKTAPSSATSRTEAGSRTPWSAAADRRQTRRVDGASGWRTNSATSSRCVVTRRGPGCGSVCPGAEGEDLVPSASRRSTT
jgi:hypothetical protein